MKRYRACWHDKDDKLQLGVLTVVRPFAEMEVSFKRLLGFTAWLQDEENNRVEF